VERRNEVTSNRAKVYLAVGTLAAAAAVPASLLSMSAGASTTACGVSCTSPYNQSLGTGQELTVSGSSVVMSAASTTNSAQDWTVEQDGDVSNAVSAGVLPAKLNMLYSTDPVVEYQYAPDGVPSDKCLSNTSTDPGNDSPYNVPTLTVVLAQCGLTAQSLWILDASNETSGYVDLINSGYAATYSYEASNSGTADDLTSPFAEPAVLTVNSSGSVVLAPLSELGGVVSTTQMWASYLATDDSSLQAKVDAKGH
jgi:hypothetical protein